MGKKEDEGGERDSTASETGHEINCEPVQPRSIPGSLNPLTGIAAESLKSLSPNAEMH